MVEPLGAGGDPSKLAREEASFRRRALDYVGTLLRSDAPTSLKALTVVLLSLFIFISFEFCMMLVEASWCFATKATMSFASYRYIMLTEVLAGVITAFPLVSRMSTVENANRLEDEFSAIKKAKMQRRKTRTDAE
jgi:hypothetical protein